jgi:Flp pilus assembly protein TadB
LLADERKGEETMAGILWAVVAILVVLWLIGFVVLHVSGALIHLLLIIAVIVLLYNLFVGGRSRRTL